MGLASPNLEISVSYGTPDFKNNNSDWKRGDNPRNLGHQIWNVSRIALFRVFVRILLQQPGTTFSTMENVIGTMKVSTNVSPSSPPMMTVPSVLRENAP
jgi:hypothetical protein